MKRLIVARESLPVGDLQRSYDQHITWLNKRLDNQELVPEPVLELKGGEQ